MESQWLDSTIINLFLILHGQCRLVGSSLPQSLGTQIDKGSIILSLYCVEHMTFLVRGTDSVKVLYWLFYTEAWKWHTSFLFIIHWPALVTWMPNCKRAGKYGKSAEMFGEFHYLCHTLLAIVWTQWGWWKCPLGDLETESSRKQWYPVRIRSDAYQETSGNRGKWEYIVFIQGLHTCYKLHNCIIASYKTWNYQPS